MAIVQPKKFLMTPSASEPATFRVVGQCLNHSVPQESYLGLSMGYSTSDVFGCTYLSQSKIYWRDFVITIMNLRVS